MKLQSSWPDDVWRPPNNTLDQFDRISRALRFFNVVALLHRTNFDFSSGGCVCYLLYVFFFLAGFFDLG